MQPATSWEERPPQSGSRPGFDSLYCEHAAYVRRLVWLYRVPPADRDDVAQAVWLVVHRRAESLAPEASPRAWLASIVRRCVADARRSERRRSHVLELQEVDQMAQSLELERWYEALELLQRAVPDERLREAFCLHAAGLSARDVAAVVEASPSTVEWWIKSARRALAAELKKQRSCSVVPFLSVDVIVNLLQAPPVEAVRAVPTRLDTSATLDPPRPREGLRWAARMAAAGRLGVGAALFALGVLVGARPRDASSITTAPASSAASASASAAPVVEVLPVVPPAAQDPTPSSVPTSSPVAPARVVPPSDAAADVLLARARAALSSSPSDALAALAEHARRWPRRHAAERDVIAVRALVALGRRADAEARATAALRASSSYRSALEAAVGPLP